MKEIGIIGFGDLGIQIQNMLEEEANSYIYYYFDDFAKGENIYPFDSYLDNKFGNLYFIVALGYKHLDTKQQILQKLIKNNRNLLTFIHKTSYINPRAQLKQGVIIYPMCNIDYACQLEEGVLLNNSVTLSHESIIKSCSFIAPGVTLSGKVVIDEKCFIGTSSSIANGIFIGKNSIIGIGSVITRNLPENTVGIGNPFRILNKNLNIQ